MEGKVLGRQSKAWVSLWFLCLFSWYHMSKLLDFHEPHFPLELSYVLHRVLWGGIKMLVSTIQIPGIKTINTTIIKAAFWGPGSGVTVMQLNPHGKERSWVCVLGALWVCQAQTAPMPIIYAGWDWGKLWYENYLSLIVCPWLKYFFISSLGRNKLFFFPNRKRNWFLDRNIR